MRENSTVRIIGVLLGACIQHGEWRSGVSLSVSTFWSSSFNFVQSQPCTSHHLLLRLLQRSCHHVRIAPAFKCSQVQRSHYLSLERFYPLIHCMYRLSPRHRLDHDTSSFVLRITIVCSNTHYKRRWDLVRKLQSINLLQDITIHHHRSTRTRTRNSNRYTRSDARSKRSNSY